MPTQTNQPPTADRKPAAAALAGLNKPHLAEAIARACESLAAADRAFVEATVGPVGEDNDGERAA